MATRIGLLLVTADLLLVAAHLLVPGTLLFDFDLDHEANVPAWYSSLQLGVLAVALFSRALEEVSRGTGRGRGWIVAGGLFLWLSLDEATALHEGTLGQILAASPRLSGLMAGAIARWPVMASMRGFAWILVLGPFAVLIVGILAAFLARRFRRHPSLVALTAAGTGLFLVALACEFVALETHGSRWYRYLVAVEEGAEMLGVSALIVAVLTDLERRVSGSDPRTRRWARRAGEILSRGVLWTALGGAFLLAAAFLYTGPPMSRGIDPGTWRAQASRNSPRMPVGFAFDRDPTTAWSTGRPMRSDDWYELNLGRPAEIRGVCLYTADRRLEHPRSLSVETSVTGDAWDTWTRGTTGFSWLANTICVRGPEPLPARLVRFRQEGRHPFHAWTIAEVYVYR